MFKSMMSIGYAILFLTMLVVIDTYADDWKFEFVTPTPRESTEQLHVKSAFYVVMFSADYCGACKISYKEDVPQLVAVMPSTVVIDIESEPQWKSSKVVRYKVGTRTHMGVLRLPTYWLIQTNDDGTESIVKEWVGRTKASTIIKEIESSLSKPKQLKVEVRAVVSMKKTNSNIYNGVRGSSHESRDTLIYHLLYENIHRGKHSREQLNMLSDESLDNMHDNDHTMRKR